MNEMWYTQVEKDIGELNKGHEQLLSRLEENTKMTKEIQDNTAGVVTAFEAASGAFKVLETIGKIAKPLLWVGGLGTGIVTGWVNFKQHLPHIFR